MVDSEVNKTISNQDQLEAQLNAVKERNKWKSHDLYSCHTKAQPETLCRRSNIPVVSSLAKHSLVSQKW